MLKAHFMLMEELQAARIPVIIRTQTIPSKTRVLLESQLDETPFCSRGSISVHQHALSKILDQFTPNSPPPLRAKMRHGPAAPLK